METRVVLILALAVAISGCADNTGNTSTGHSSQKDLEIQSLGVSDETLTPGQQTKLSLTLKNHHTQSISITDISVFNDGQIIVGQDATKNDENKEPHCSSNQIQTAKEGVAPEMVCTWTLTAPSKEDLGAFNSKPMPINVKIAYESNLINSEPLKLQFKPLSEIEKAEPLKKTYSNGEIKASMEVENPAPFSGRIIYFTAENSGPGSVENGYNFEYRPSSVLEDCMEKHEEEEPVIGSEVKFSCQASLNSDKEAVRNLFTSISYKYVKTPTVDIEVVSR